LRSRAASNGHGGGSLSEEHCIFNPPKDVNANL